MDCSHSILTLVHAHLIEPDSPCTVPPVPCRHTLQPRPGRCRCGRSCHLCSLCGYAGRQPCCLQRRGSLRCRWLPPDTGRGGCDGPTGPPAAGEHCPGNGGCPGAPAPAQHQRRWSVCGLHVGHRCAGACRNARPALAGASRHGASTKHTSPTRAPLLNHLAQSSLSCCPLWALKTPPPTPSQARGVSHCIIHSTVHPTCL